MSELPVICEPGYSARRLRQAQIRALLTSGARGVREMERGLELKFPGDPMWIARITDLIIKERDCCPFLRFELTAEPAGGPVTFRVTGPEGTLDFLQGWI